MSKYNVEVFSTSGKVIASFKSPDMIACYPGRMYSFKTPKGNSYYTSSPILVTVKYESLFDVEQVERSVIGDAMLLNHEGEVIRIIRDVTMTFDDGSTNFIDVNNNQYVTTLPFCMEANGDNSTSENGGWDRNVNRHLHMSGLVRLQDTNLI